MHDEFLGKSEAMLHRRLEKNVGPGARGERAPGPGHCILLQQSSILLDDLCNDTCADGTATFADCEAQTFFW
ncbi:hypothetical protein, partial [Paraburkholderia sp. C35]|uniref:hypothetical protein n=1 Tax=Paraburkholderia sp. C35 TaxID=2126993 RepID=UPI001EF46F99